MEVYAVLSLRTLHWSLDLVFCTIKLHRLKDEQENITVILW